MPRFRLGVIRRQVIEETGHAEIEAATIEEAARQLPSGRSSTGAAGGTLPTSAQALDGSDGNGIARGLGKEELIDCETRIISWTEGGTAFDLAPAQADTETLIQALRAHGLAVTAFGAADTPDWVDWARAELGAEDWFAGKASELEGTLAGAGNAVLDTMARLDGLPQIGEAV